MEGVAVAISNGRGWTEKTTRTDQVGVLASTLPFAALRYSLLKEGESRVPGISRQLEDS